MMIGSMEDDHQWYDAARIEEVAAVTSGGLTISRAAWNQTASRQRCPFLLPEMKLSALGNLETLVAKSGLAQNWPMSLQVGQSRAAVGSMALLASIASAEEPEDWVAPLSSAALYAASSSVGSPSPMSSVLFSTDAPFWRAPSRLARVHDESRAARIHGVACVNSERRGARGLGGA